MRCPECGRIASVHDDCERPICIHAWDNWVPEIWDANNCGGDGWESIEESPNPLYRVPGPLTWTAMVPLDESGANG